MGSKSLEIKVGVFLLLSVGVVVAFLIVLGNFGFSSGQTFYVDLTNSGGLRKGAKIKISGVRAGNLSEIRFLGVSEVDEQGNPIYVRVTIQIFDEMVGSLTEGSAFFVSTEGLLGEKYIEVTPGPPGSRPIEPGSVLRGEPPVELQVLAARAAGMMDKVQKLLEGDRGDISGMADNLKEVLERTRRITETLDAELPGLVDRGNETLDKATASLDKLDGFVEDGRELIQGEKGIREAVAHVSDLSVTIEAELPHLVDSLDELMEESHQLVAETRKTVASLEDELAATTRDARGLIARAGRIVSSVDLTELIEDLRTSMVELVENFNNTGKLLAGLAVRTDGVVADLADVISYVMKGKGTLGAILKDREIYDDVRELVLDLKRNPWKIVFKP